MSEEQTNEVVEEIQEQPEIDYKALSEKLQSDLESVVAKKDELLGETKKAKEARAEAKAQALADQQKNGEFEKLWKGSEEKNADLVGTINNMKSATRQATINSDAIKIANELAKGSAESAELLKDYIRQSLDKLADDLGNTDVDALESVKNTFLNNAKYAPLMGGTQATGGGAIGNTSSAQHKQKENDNLTPEQRLARHYTK